MRNLITGLQHEGVSQTKALATVQNLLRWMQENYPMLSAVSTSLLIKKCLEEINGDGFKISAS
jgi:hypothetical protein